MSSTVEFVGPPGQSLTLLVCAAGAYTPANGAGDAATETARAGVYTATVAETPALSGLHSAHIVSNAGWELPLGHVDLVDGQVCRVHEHDPDADSETAAAVWAYGTRTLTQTAAAVAAALAGSTITVRRGDTLTVSITGLGSLAGRTKLWVTGKADRGHPDGAALFLIEETARLQIINGSIATTPANGTLTVTDAVAGNLTIVLAGVETAKLAELTGGAYDVQVLETAGPRTLTDGTLNVTLDVTRAVS